MYTFILVVDSLYISPFKYKSCIVVLIYVVCVMSSFSVKHDFKNIKLLKMFHYYIFHTVRLDLWSC